MGNKAHMVIFFAWHFLHVSENLAQQQLAHNTADTRS